MTSTFDILSPRSEICAIHIYDYLRVTPVVQLNDENIHWRRLTNTTNTFPSNNLQIIEYSSKNNSEKNNLLIKFKSACIRVASALKFELIDSNYHAPKLQSFFTLQARI